MAVRSGSGWPRGLMLWGWGGCRPVAALALLNSSRQSDVNRSTKCKREIAAGVRAHAGGRMRSRTPSPAHAPTARSWHNLCPGRGSSPARGQGSGRGCVPAAAVAPHPRRLRGRGRPPIGAGRSRCPLPAAAAPCHDKPLQLNAVFSSRRHGGVSSRRLCRGGRRRAVESVRAGAGRCWAGGEGVDAARRGDLAHSAAGAVHRRGQARAEGICTRQRQRRSVRGSGGGEGRGRTVGAGGAALVPVERQPQRRLYRAAGPLDLRLGLRRFRARRLGLLGAELIDDDLDGLP